MRHARYAFLATMALPLVAQLGLAQTAPRDSAAALEFFEKKVRPILVDNCYTCHSADTNAKGGLRLDDRNGIVQGGNSGPAILVGKPEKSLLIQAVRHADGVSKMPPKKQLDEEQVADLERWIKDGAAWPAEATAPVVSGQPNPKYERLRKDHWAWQPLQAAPVPMVEGTWARDDVDRFLLAGMQARGLHPVGDADRRTLLRRVTFDLTGLPPTPEEQAAFLQDTADGAWEKVVDRLLASPAFGERWGRHWLDVARYGESTGSSRNVPYPQAWRYRDYVIDSINHDKPYDQFLREQIAGDLLPASTSAERDEHRIATGFLALGVKDVNQRFKVRFVMDNIDEQIDTVTRSVLALTVSCARCHDHKFDPIPTADYYALAGIFHSTDLCAGVRNKMGGSGMAYYDPSMLVRIQEDAPPDPKVVAQVSHLKKQLDEATARFEALRGTPEGKEPGPDGKPKQQAMRQQMTQLQSELDALSGPANTSRVTLGVREAHEVGDTEIRIRGEAEKLGPVVPRGFLSVLNVPEAAPVNSKQSGRLELAQWLTSPKNPLTARVIVNRVWQHLFGQGLVASVDNFGVTGEAPSNLALLDHLAARFVREGWSIKRLVRELALTHAYQLSGDAPESARSIDPANRLVWRQAPRRLDAEEIRDAMLSAAGTLDTNRPAGSPAQDLKVMELGNTSPTARKLESEALTSRYRSVYLPLVRGVTPHSLAVFDFAEQGMVTGYRDTTTVATQALYLLNDSLVHREAQAMADRVMHRSEAPAERIEYAYQLALGRGATPAEVRRATRFIGEFEEAAKATGPAAPTGPKGRPASQKPAGPNASDSEGLSADATPAPTTQAWATFCQALLGSAEFRYRP